MIYSDVIMELWILIPVTIVFTTTSGKSCDSYGCYTNMGTTKKFDKAREICQMQNLTLIQIKNAEMSKNILSMFEIQYMWLDYEVFVYNRPKWLDGKYVELEDLGKDICVYISEDISSEIKGNTAPCDHKLLFICSYNKDRKGSQQGLRLSTEKESWFDARKFCQRGGGDLYLQGDGKKTQTLELNYTTKYWIGARTVTWFTADNKEAIYTNWSVGQPLDPIRNKCVKMDKNGEWYSSHCFSVRSDYNVICYNESKNPEKHTKNAENSKIHWKKGTAFIVTGTLSVILVVAAVLTSITIFKWHQRKKLRNTQNEKDRQMQDDTQLYDLPIPAYGQNKTHKDDIATYDLPISAYGQNKTHKDDIATYDDVEVMSQSNTPSNEEPYDTDLYDNPMYGSKENVILGSDMAAIDIEPAPRKPPRVFADCPEFEICENEIYDST